MKKHTYEFYVKRLNKLGIRDILAYGKQIEIRFTDFEGRNIMVFIHNLTDYRIYDAPLSISRADRIIHSSNNWKDFYKKLKELKGTNQRQNQQKKSSTFQ